MFVRPLIDRDLFGTDGSFEEGAVWVKVVLGTGKLDRGTV
jgi:hypothetical protein